jgi:hypothetical protein
MKMKTLLIALFLLALSTLGQAKTDASNYIFAVVETEAGLNVFINSYGYWAEHGSLIDSYESEEANDFINSEMNDLDLCNAMESTFEPCGKTFSKATYVKALEKRGFIHLQSFEDWMINETKSL